MPSNPENIENPQNTESEINIGEQISCLFIVLEISSDKTNPINKKSDKIIFPRFVISYDGIPIKSATK
jgi:hypothetical protein